MDKLLTIANKLIEQAKVQSPVKADYQEFTQYVLLNFPEPNPDSQDYQDIIKDTHALISKTGRWADFPVFPEDIHPVVYPIAVIKLTLTKPVDCPDYWIDYWPGCIEQLHLRYGKLINEACMLT